jgi:hypothetical protein
MEEKSLDLTPYEEDDDLTLHRKFVAARIARKRAEEDLKLICNRIGLLKQEESKVIKQQSHDFYRLRVKWKRQGNGHKTL